MTPHPTPPPSVMRCLEAVFAGRPWITHAEAARLLEVDTKTLTRAGDAGQIFYRLKGVRRAYTIEDLADYIGGRGSCQSTAPAHATRSRANGSTSQRSGTTISSSRSPGSVVDFTAAQAKQRNARRRSSSARSANGSVPKGQMTT